MSDFNLARLIGTFPALTIGELRRIKNAANKEIRDKVDRATVHRDHESKPLCGSMAESDLLNSEFDPGYVFNCPTCVRLTIEEECGSELPEPMYNARTRDLEIVLGLSATFARKIASALPSSRKNQVGHWEFAWLEGLNFAYYLLNEKKSHEGRGHERARS